METLIEQKFVDKIIKEGYPKESISLSSFIDSFMSSITIIDPNTKVILAVFKIRKRDEESSLETKIITERLKAISKQYGHKIAIFSTLYEDNKFKTERISGIFTGKEKKTEIPSFDFLKSNINNLPVKKEKRKRDKISTWSIALGIILIFWLISDRLCIYLISYERILIFLLLFAIFSGLIKYIVEFGFSYDGFNFKLDKEEKKVNKKQ